MAIQVKKLVLFFFTALFGFVVTVTFLSARNLKKKNDKLLTSFVRNCGTSVDNYLRHFRARSEDKTVLGLLNYTKNPYNVGKVDFYSDLVIDELVEVYTKRYPNERPDEIKNKIAQHFADKNFSAVIGTNFLYENFNTKLKSPHIDFIGRFLSFLSPRLFLSQVKTLAGFSSDNSQEINESEKSILILTADRLFLYDASKYVESAINGATCTGKEVELSKHPYVLLKAIALLDQLS